MFDTDFAQTSAVHSLRKPLAPKFALVNFCITGGMESVRNTESMRTCLHQCVQPLGRLTTTTT